MSRSQELEVRAIYSERKNKWNARPDNLLYLNLDEEEGSVGLLKLL